MRLVVVTQSGCTSPISAIPEPPILVKLKGNQATFALIGSILNLKVIAHKLNVVIFNDLTLSTSSCPKKTCPAALLNIMARIAATTHLIYLSQPPQCKILHTVLSRIYALLCKKRGKVWHHKAAHHCGQSNIASCL